MPSTERRVLSSALSLSPDGKRLISGGPNGTPLIWSSQDLRGEPIELIRHTGVTALAFGVDHIATGGGEGIVRFYVLSGGKPQVESVREPEKGQESAIVALALSPVGSWLALSDQDGRVVLWNGKIGERPLPNRSDAIRSLTFSSDGRFLAGLSQSDAVQLWRIEGQPVEPVLLAENQAVQVLGFSSDGQLVTASEGGTVRRWETDLNKLLKIACQVVGRNLTRKEWETYLPGEPYNPREPCPNLPPES